MKKTIYNYFFYEFIRLFAIVLFAWTAIIWTIQAVNFLDLVTEDGHAFRVYLLYSALTIPKILTKLIPFSFLIASILTILKLEKDNELIILWTSGLNNIHNVNLDAKIIQEKANNGDEKSLEFIFQYLDYLARGLSQVINIIDPGAIVLGGGVSNMKQIYGNINSKLKKYVFSDTVNTEVLKNIHGDSSGVRGAASLGR